jgi:RHS repeat-associated protein
LENILNSITYPSGRTVIYTLDQIGRIAQVSTTLNGNPKTLASAISYLPYGGITGLNYGNGLSLSHGYDNQYRTSSIAIGSIMNKAYQYDPNGNIISILDTIEPSGNEVFEDAGIYTYQQATNKLTQVTGEINVVYGYDANGNITSANNRIFVYDLSNRLIRVEDNGLIIAEYVYNGLNQRIKKILPSETRIFHYDLLGHLVAETNESEAMLAEYVYLGDQPIAMIRPGEMAYYYHNDHLGTPQILTDEARTISWKGVYTPFGEAVITIGTVENLFRFPGQYYDQETGLHYNWNRYYDPKTGRYLSPDPIGLEGGINLFPYVANNPINFTDPLGLMDRYTYCKGIPGCKEATDKACSSSVQAAMLCCKYDFDGCLIDIGYPACEEWDQNQCIAKYLQCLKNAKPKKERKPLEPPLPVPPNPPYPGNPKVPYPPS